MGPRPDGASGRNTKPQVLFCSFLQARCLSGALPLHATGISQVTAASQPLSFSVTACEVKADRSHERWRDPIAADGDSRRLGGEGRAAGRGWDGLGVAASLLPPKHHGTSGWTAELQLGAAPGCCQEMSRIPPPYKTPSIPSKEPPGSRQIWKTTTGALLGEGTVPTVGYWTHRLAQRSRRSPWEQRQILLPRSKSIRTH